MEIDQEESMDVETGKEDSRNVKIDQEESLDGEMGLEEFVDMETGQEESLKMNTIIEVL